MFINKLNFINLENIPNIVFVNIIHLVWSHLKNT